jgi:hypothetical protein
MWWLFLWIPLALFIIWVGGGMILDLAPNWPMRELRKRILTVEYHRLSSGDVFRPMGPKHIKHCCARPTGWDEVRKSIWICDCGRMYIRRGEQVGRWRKRHNYWWRIRPYRVATYIRARDLKKNQYKKVTTGGVS